jgi:hypothetical protein
MSVWDIGSVSEGMMRARPILLVMFAWTLHACAADGSLPHEYLDEKTAATVTTAAKPMVFAHERPDVAAHSREYVTLAPAALDRGGAIDYYLFAYFWSTVDPRSTTHSTTGAGQLTLLADDRHIQPALFGHSAEEAGVGNALAAPPGHQWVLQVYRTDIPTLRFLSEARQITVAIETPQGPVAYDLWRDQRESLKALVQRLEGR